MSDIDLNDIRRLDGGLLLIFRGLLRRRRTTVVADELGLSQSAVSHALTRLRDLFEDPLFIRRPHGLEPTRRALELGPRIDALIDRIGEALQRGTEFDPARSARRFLISAPEFVTELIGGKLTRSFQTAAPHASFVVSFQPLEASLAALRRGEIDLALGRFGALAPEFAPEKLYDDRYCVAARRRHPVLKGAITLEQYSAIGHIYAGSMSEGSDEERNAADMIDARFVAVVPRWLTALVMVAQSDAIATCPRRLAERQAKMLGLQVIDPPFTPKTIRVAAVRRAAVQDSGVDWLLARIREAAVV